MSKHRAVENPHARTPEEQAAWEAEQAEPVPEDVGEAVRASVTIQPRAFHIHLDIAGGATVDLMVPHDQVPMLDAITATLPTLISQALQLLRSPAEELDDGE